MWLACLTPRLEVAIHCAGGFLSPAQDSQADADPLAQSARPPSPLSSHPLISIPEGLLKWLGSTLTVSTPLFERTPSSLAAA